MERRELERQIVEKEWLMFQQVQGVNGRAACQDDWTTFLIMRLSQFEGWDTDVLESYFEDIVQAEAQEKSHYGEICLYDGGNRPGIFLIN